MKLKHNRCTYHSLRAGALRYSGYNYLTIKSKRGKQNSKTNQFDSNCCVVTLTRYRSGGRAGLFNYRINRSNRKWAGGGEIKDGASLSTAGPPADPVLFCFILEIDVLIILTRNTVCVGPTVRTYGVERSLLSMSKGFC